MAILPERIRINKLNGNLIEKVVRPEPGKLISPFESIRPAEIIPIFLEKFEVIEKFEFNRILRLIMPMGAKLEYLENEESSISILIPLFSEVEPLHQSSARSTIRLYLLLLLQYLYQTLKRRGVEA